MSKFHYIEKVKSSNLGKKVSKLVHLNRVVKVTKGGRYFSYRALMAVGNEEGVVGYGTGKAKEISESISKAEENANKNLFRIPVFRGNIPHEQEACYGGARVFIRPASSGTGIIAGSAVRYVLEVAGVKNVLSKSKGSSNPYNVLKATLKALLEMRDIKTIAKQRGITINKIYKG